MLKVINLFQQNVPIIPKMLKSIISILAFCIIFLVNVKRHIDKFHKGYFSIFHHSTFFFDVTAWKCLLLAFWNSTFWPCIQKKVSIIYHHRTHFNLKNGNHILDKIFFKTIKIWQNFCGDVRFAKNVSAEKMPNY